MHQTRLDRIEGVFVFFFSSKTKELGGSFHKRDSGGGRGRGGDFQKEKTRIRRAETIIEVKNGHFSFLDVGDFHAKKQKTGHVFAHFFISLHFLTRIYHYSLTMMLVQSEYFSALGMLSLSSKAANQSSAVQSSLNERFQNWAFFCPLFVQRTNYQLL